MLERQQRCVVVSLIKWLFEPLTNELKPVVATSVQYFGIFAGYRVI